MVGGPTEGCRWAILAATLIALAGLLVVSAPARAGAYHDFLCQIPYGAPAGRPAPADDVAYATNGTYTFAGNSCESGGALFAAMGGEVAHPFGAGGIVTFTAPAGMTIGAFNLWRSEQDG